MSGQMQGKSLMAESRLWEIVNKGRHNIYDPWPLFVCFRASKESRRIIHRKEQCFSNLHVVQYAYMTMVVWQTWGKWTSHLQPKVTVPGAPAALSHLRAKTNSRLYIYNPFSPVVLLWRRGKQSFKELRLEFKLQNKKKGNFCIRIINWLHKPSWKESNPTSYLSFIYTADQNFHSNLWAISLSL